ncbi:hypothetical protein GCM10023166_12480 [Paeniglutamicibacter cryotolerans]
MRGVRQKEQEQADAPILEGRDSRAHGNNVGSGDAQRLRNAHSTPDRHPGLFAEFHAERGKCAPDPVPDLNPESAVPQRLGDTAAFGQQPDSQLRALVRCTTGAGRPQP